MFNLIRKNKKNSKTDKRIVAPVTGKCVDLSQVPDPMFAKKTMGDGVAFIYEGGDTVYSPCEGVILVVAATKHAVGIKSASGTELLLHVGVDTVSLNGQGFTSLVTKDQKVKIGTPLLKIDRKFMEENDVDLITSMVVTNGPSVNVEIKGINTAVEQGVSEIIVEK